MPYIEQERREIIERDFIAPCNAGELNYRITSLVLEYLGENPGYKSYNEAIGALECAKLELYRRSIVPYENRKIIQNGDLPYP